MRLRRDSETFCRFWYAQVISRHRECFWLSQPVSLLPTGRVWACRTSCVDKGLCWPPYLPQSIGKSTNKLLFLLLSMTKFGPAVACCSESVSWRKMFQLQCNFVIISREVETLKSVVSGKTPTFARERVHIAGGIGEPEAEGTALQGALSLPSPVFHSSLWGLEKTHRMTWHAAQVTASMQETGGIRLGNLVTYWPDELITRLCGFGPVDTDGIALTQSEFHSKCLAIETICRKFVPC